MTAIQRYGHTEKDQAEKTLDKNILKIIGNDWMYYCTLPIDQIPNEKARFIRAYSTNRNAVKS